jgi:hypothetical protein
LRELVFTQVEPFQIDQIADGFRQPYEFVAAKVKTTTAK